MQVSRRTFFKGFAAAAAVATLPFPEAVTNPYGEMSITYASGGDYGIVVDAAGHNKEDVYDFVKKQLRSV